MQSVLQGMEERLRGYEARLSQTAQLEQRMLQAESGLAQASQVIGEQRRAMDDFALNRAAQHSLTPTPAPAQTQSFIDTRAVGKPPSFSGEMCAD